jgi:LL-diaminopimelate aminotransferase
MKVSTRLETLPPYLAADIAARAAAFRNQGIDVVNLSVGSPDLPPDPRVVEAARQALLDEGSHGYEIGRGHPEFRRAVADYMDRRFGLSLDPDTQVLALLGSKEGLGHLPIALCDPGDIGVYPDPGYPVYRPSLLLAGARPLPLPLSPGAGWSPRWDRLEEGVAAAREGNQGEPPAGPVRLIIVNYPHNPTSATVELADFDAAIRRARELDAVLVNDNAYADIGFDDYRSPSLLQASEARGGGEGSGVVEFHSMSKTFSMAGWRCAFAVGDPQVIAALHRTKTFYDTGLFAVIQRAAAAALDLSEEIAQSVSDRYQSRRDLLKPALDQLGLVAEIPRATIYLWARLPADNPDDAAYCRSVLEGAHVALSQGSGYGGQGAGFVRFSLTAPEKRLLEAVDRLEKLGAGS